MKRASGSRSRSRSPERAGSSSHSDRRQRSPAHTKSEDSSADDIDRERAERRRRALERESLREPASASGPASSARAPSASSSASRNPSTSVARMVAGTAAGEEDYAWGSAAASRDETQAASAAPTLSSATSASTGTAAPAGPPKVKPNFALSGKLYEAEMTNANGVVSKYAEPADAAQPDRHWRVYVFKQGTEGIQDTLHIHRQQKYAIGRDPRAADICVEHGSCSKQHAVIQYRRREVMDDTQLTTKLVIKCVVCPRSSVAAFALCILCALIPYSAACTACFQSQTLHHGPRQHKWHVSQWQAFGKRAFLRALAARRGEIWREHARVCVYSNRLMEYTNPVRELLLGGRLPLNIELDGLAGLVRRQAETRTRGASKRVAQIALCEMKKTHNSIVVRKTWVSTLVTVSREISVTRRTLPHADLGASLATPSTSS